ncbi:nicotinamide N-methyltransferase [Scleropages formosus]|uniref:Zgc:64002 n=1 Tax=Scleropages formosus TaxID=113540 RepID=A0A8C9VPX3_SCLFO|nr:nicotinamide N-methyltransferase-like [Scleropages formosus]
MEKSEQTIFTEGEFYQAHFDPKTYLNSFFSLPQGHCEENYLELELRQLTNTFKTGKWKGKRLIEIGSGPSIVSLISACEHFEEIVMSDFADRNRQEIESWLREDEGCFDWDPIIQFVCKLEGNRTPMEVKVRLRQTVKQVLMCDVRLENPFEPLEVEPADCVVTTLCLEAACKDLDIYQRALQSLKALLKPGGVLVMTGALNETFYMVGGQRFSCLPLSKDIVQGMLRNLGFSIEHFNLLPIQERYEKLISDFDGIFHVVACKPA